MFDRSAVKRVNELANLFPAVLILGPRQVGKTTLVQRAFPQVPYCDLEDPSTRELFDSEPRFQIEQRSAGARLILDEAQAVPRVFSALRGIIDRARSVRGRFILLGSAQPSLVKQVSESLAGRVGIVELDPLTAAEASTGDSPRNWEQVWLTGGFPDALQADSHEGSFRDWWEAYLRTYVERDLPFLGVGADPLLLRRLLTMLAHSQAGLLNKSRLGSSLGVSATTLSRYMDILERTFLLRRLPPYHRNIGKRLVKSPKVYLRDTGLVHHLLGIASHESLMSHPIRGQSWETFVVEDLIRRERLEHPHSQFFFWRTAAGAELDLVGERDGRPVGIEVKTAQAAGGYFIRSLRKVAADLDGMSIIVIDQSDGVEPLAPAIERRGFAESLSWLPSDF